MSYGWSFSLRFILISLFLLTIVTLHGQANAAQLNLTWKDNSSNEDGFEIKRLTGSTYSEIATVGANSTSYVDSGLLDETLYCYQVYAYNLSGDSASSDTACATTPNPNIDTDGDGLTDADEQNYGTNPILADTDGDGINDSDEVSQGSDPLNPNSTPTGPDNPYTEGNWTDYRVTLTMRSEDNDAIGVMFRYQDSNNYYRFSWDAQRSYRRLVKRENGVFTLLAEDSVPFVVGQIYQVEVIADGVTLEILIDGALIFSVTDTSFATGSIALYSWGNRGSHLDDILVEELSTGNVLLWDDFNGGDLSGWSIVDEGTKSAPSVWSAATGTLVQSSNIYSNPTGAADLAKLGTYALHEAGGEASWHLEAGEVTINHTWKRVEFNEPFVDPVVVAKPLSFNGGQPAVVRIRNVDPTGFEIRIQEWEYLDQWHTLETVGYIVMERGSYILDDGTLIEADTIDTDRTSSFDLVSFNQLFNIVPVLFTTITSFNGSDTVTGRVRNINTQDFEFRMQEQESNSQVHTTEVISYIAWEPSAGAINGLTFEVNATQDVMTHRWRHIPFNESFKDSPVFLADMQTSDGGDTAALRWQDKDSIGVEVKVEEERSRDTEIAHTTEIVGYMVFALE